MATEITAIKEAYAALNRNDVAGFVNFFDPQIERIEAFNLERPDIYRAAGVRGRRAHMILRYGGLFQAGARQTNVSACVYAPSNSFRGTFCRRHSSATKSRFETSAAGVRVLGAKR